MSTITFPSNTNTVVNDIRDVIGRLVTFYKQYRQDCPVCDLDPVTDTSTNPYCITCSGRGYTYTYSGSDIRAHITWAPSETLGWVSGGQYIDGDCRIQIEYTTQNITVIDESSYAMVDGKKFIIRKKMFRGVPELNRILIDLSEEED